MIDKLYSQVISQLREFVNTTNRYDAKKVVIVEDFLNNIIKRIQFISKESQNKALENRLLKELKRLSKSIFIRTNNDDIYNKKLQQSIDRLSWINLKHKINNSGRKYTVAQREIFYANLGENIGSEQNGRRPVIILQNNTGNRKGNTTIIAPVTTHQKSPLHYDKSVKKYFIEKHGRNGSELKYLGQYEIPLKLEDSRNGIYGFINVMHIREIDRKRIDSHKIGIATEECFAQVIKAINKNLQV